MKSIIIYNNYSLALKMRTTTSDLASSKPSLVVFVGPTLHINGLKSSSKLVPDTEFGTVTSQDRLNYTFIPFINENYFSRTLS